MTAKSRNPLFTGILLAALMLGIPASASVWLYDGGPTSIYGATLGGGYSTLMVAQPFGFIQPVQVDQIGVAVAQGADPNNVGFRVSLTTSLNNPHSNALGTWNIHPVDGPILTYTYVSTTPLRLEANRFYYIVFSPGDKSFFGGVGFSFLGYPGLAIRDTGGEWFETHPFAVRIGGSVVPEPSGTISLMGGCLLMLMYLRRRI